MIKWKRESGSIIELRDTPAMTDYAKSKGWKKVQKKRVVKNDGDSGKHNS